MKKADVRQELTEAVDLLELLDYLVDSVEEQRILSDVLPWRGIKSTLNRVRSQVVGALGSLDLSHVVLGSNLPNPQTTNSESNISSNTLPSNNLSNTLSSGSSSMSAKPITSSPLAGRIKRMPLQVARVQEVGLDELTAEAVQDWEELDLTEEVRQSAR